jgi:hypothetical protein
VSDVKMNMTSGMTPKQGRVQFHQERILRSTGGGSQAHAPYIALCRQHGVPELVGEMSDTQCRQALFLLEVAAKQQKYSAVRDVRTGWETLNG